MPPVQTLQIAPAADAPTLARGADRPASNATEGALPTPAPERSETEEAQAPAGITAWVIGLVGMTAVGARWYQKRKRGASVPTVAVRAIPAPHKARARARV